MRIGINQNATYLTDYGPQHYFTNLFRSARGHRVFHGARVDANGYPARTDPGNPLSRISYDMAHWRGGLPEPYHGSFALFVDGAAEVTIKRKDRSGGTIDTLYRGVHQGPVQLPVTIPPTDHASSIHVTFRHVSRPVTELALVC